MRWIKRVFVMFATTLYIFIMLSLVIGICDLLELFYIAIINKR